MRKHTLVLDLTDTDVLALQAVLAFGLTRWPAEELPLLGGVERKLYNAVNAAQKRMLFGLTAIDLELTPGEISEARITLAGNASQSHYSEARSLYSKFERAVQAGQTGHHWLLDK